MSAKHWGPVAAVLATFLAGSSCQPGKSKEKTIFIPGDLTSLELTLQAPTSGQFDSFSELCVAAGAASLLITIDTAMQPEAYTLLADLQGRLYNCGGLCENGTGIQGTLAPTRIVVEAVSEIPSEYLNQNEFDVVCRGIADADLGMGSIVVATPAPPASPGAAPQETPVTTVTSIVPMLRIGDFNGTFDDAGEALPTGRHLAASSLAPRETITGRAPDGGRIVAGGGLVSDVPTSALFEFDPVSIGFSTAGSLSLARYGLTATAIDSAGAPVVLFAGGSSDPGSIFEATAAADLYRPGATPSTEARTMLVPRAFHTATYVHEHNEDEPVVVLIGGCTGGDASPAAAADYEYFFGELPATDPGGCGATQDQAQFCKPNAAAAMSEGHCQHAAAPLVDNSNPSIFVAGGISNDSTVLIETYRFNASGNGGFAPQNDLTVEARGAAAESLLVDLAASLGGFTNAGSFNASAGWTRYQAGGTLTDGPLMNVQRGFHAARQTLDRTVLVTGGTDDSVFPDGLVSVERLTPATTAGAFEYLTRPGATSACVDGTTPADCVTMVGSRYGHQSVLVEGSSTWLNGALLVVGGGQVPEIFVPSYACNGSDDPIDVENQVIAGVDFCDRGRQFVAPTNLSPPN